MKRHFCMWLLKSQSCLLLILVIKVGVKMEYLLGGARLGVTDTASTTSTGFQGVLLWSEVGKHLRT